VTFDKPQITRECSHAFKSLLLLPRSWPGTRRHQGLCACVTDPSAQSFGSVTSSEAQRFCDDSTTEELKRIVIQDPLLSPVTDR
jgi:hypothetical protein